MDNKMLIGCEIVNEACMVFVAAMDDDSNRPAVVLTVDLEGYGATIDTLAFEVNGPDSVKAGPLDTIKLFNLTLSEYLNTNGNKQFFGYEVPDYTLPASVIDVSKVHWYEDVQTCLHGAIYSYELEGLINWDDPDCMRLRMWKSAWWRLVVDLFDLDMDI